MLYVPGVRERLLVGHLDEAICIEKALLESWKRTEGCTGSNEERRLQHGIERFYTRHAFPDGFNTWLGSLRRAILKRHGSQNSADGKLMRAIRELRVQPRDGWDDKSVSIVLLGFVHSGDFADDGELDALASAFQTLIKRHLKTRAVEGVTFSLDAESGVVEYSDITADEYLATLPLDLEYLSHRDAALLHEPDR